MYGFLYNDFYINKKQHISSLIMLIVLNALSLVPLLVVCNALSEMGTDTSIIKMVSFAFGVVGVFISFFVIDVSASNVVTCDERKKWAYYVAASEKGISDYIASKYISCLIIAYLGVTISMLENAVFVDILGEDRIFNAGSLYPFIISIFLFFKSFEMPFLYAFSSKYGNYVRMIFSGIFFTGFVIYFLFGNLSFWESGDEIFNKIAEFLSQDRSAEFYIAVSAFSISVLPLFYLSYCISKRVYMKGTENYDK